MLQEIIPAITPSNINDIKLIQDSINIFLEYLSKNSDISIDIKNILNQDKTVIYDEFIKIYLNSINSVLHNSKHNEALYNALKVNYSIAKKNIDDIKLSIDTTKLLTKDYIITNKDYKQAKGTPTAIEYIYNIVFNSGIQNNSFNDNSSGFQYYEGPNLFEYKVEGTMIDNVYETFVKPLTHPVGWAYTYQRIFYQAFTDYFNILFNYQFSENGFEVRCMNGETFNNDNYLKNISHTGKKLVQDNTVTFISNKVIGEGTNAIKRITIYFASGETLVSDDNPRSLILYKAPEKNIELNPKITNDNILINYNNYDGNCGLYLDYNVIIKSNVKEEIDFKDTSSIASTVGKKNVVGAGNVFIGNVIIGSELVNKDVDVTYGPYVDNGDGTDNINHFSANNIELNKLNLSNVISTSKEYYFDEPDLMWGKFDFDSHSTINTSKEYYFDEPDLMWGKFDFDSHGTINSLKEYYFDEPDLMWGKFDFDSHGTINSSKIKYYFDEPDLMWGKFNFDDYIDSTNNSNVIYSSAGKIANDDYEIVQILSYCPVNEEKPVLSNGKENHICKNEIIDYMGTDNNYVSEDFGFEIVYSENRWDTDLHFGKFKFDDYSLEEFENAYSENRWDTDLHFGKFKFDGYSLKESKVIDKWDTGLHFSEFKFDEKSKVIDRWDAGLHFEEFKFDEYSSK